MEPGRSALPPQPVRAAVVIALSGLISRALGLFRDRLFAHTFGAGEVLDAYFAAYRVPDLLYNLLIVGALSAAFVPVASHYFASGSEGRASAFRMTNALLTLAVLVLSIIAVILFFLTPRLIPLFVPGFDPARTALTVLFTRIMLLQPILLGASSIVSGLLLTLRRFAAYAAAPVAYNVGIIVGLLVFVPWFGLSGLAWGVVLGALGHLAVQLPSAARTGFRFQIVLTTAQDGLRRVSKLFLPRLVALLAGQVSDVVVTVLGSGLLAGSITAYLLAENLQTVPVGLVGIPLGVAAFPFLAAAAARQRAEEFATTLFSTLRLTLFIALPASVFLVLLRAQVVRVVLGTGAFDWNDTRATFTVLGILALAVVAQSLLPLLSRAFFALHDTRTPMMVSLLAITVNVGSAFLLVPRFGIGGLAWATTLSALLHFLLLLTILHHRLGGLQDRVFLLSALRVGLASLGAGLAIQGPYVLFAQIGIAVDGWPQPLLALALGLKGIIASLVNMQTFAGIATQLIGSLLGGILAFLCIAALLRAPELKLLRALWKAPAWSAVLPSFLSRNSA